MAHARIEGQRDYSVERCGADELRDIGAPADAKRWRVEFTAGGRAVRWIWFGDEDRANLAGDRFVRGGRGGVVGSP